MKGQQTQGSAMTRQIQGVLAAMEENKLRAILDFIPDPIVVTDLIGTIVGCNQSALNAAEANSELVGRSAYDLVAPVDRRRVYRYVKEVVKQDIKKNIEFTLLSNEGGEQYFELTIGLVRDSHGHPESFVAIARDISGHKRVEETLMDQKNCLRSAFNNTSVGILLSDEEGYAMLVNDAYCDFLGYSRQELLGQHFASFTFQEDVQTNVGLHQDLVAGKIDSYVIEKRYIRKDGAVVWGRLSISLARNDESRHRNKVIIICEDISEWKRAEQAILKSEIQLRHITAHMSDMIVELDAGGILKYASPSHESILGYKTEALLERSFFDLVHPDDQKRVLTAAERCTGAEMARIEYRIRHADDHYLWVETEIKPLPEETGLARGAILSTRDITMRKRVDMALKESEERFRALFENAPLGIAICLPNGKILLPNQACLFMFGYQGVLEFTDRSCIEYLAPECRQGFLEILKRHQQGEVMPSLYETVAMRKDGTTFPVFLEVSNIDLPDLSVAVVFICDIAELKKAEDGLRKSEEKYRQIVETANEGIWYLDEENRTVFVNQKMAEMLGYAIDEMIGRTDYSFMDERWRRIAEGYTVRRKQGIRDQYEHQLLRKDGLSLSVFVSAAPIFNDHGGYEGAIGMFTGIAGQKQTEPTL